MRSLAKNLTELVPMLALLAALGLLSLPETAHAELVVESPDAATAPENDPNDVVAPSTTDEVSKGCTAVCLNSGEDPYRCEEDCVFVTDEKSATQACEG